MAHILCAAVIVNFGRIGSKHEDCDRTKTNSRGSSQQSRLWLTTHPPLLLSQAAGCVMQPQVLACVALRLLAGDFVKESVTGFVVSVLHRAQAEP